MTLKRPAVIVIGFATLFLALSVGSAKGSGVGVVYELSAKATATSGDFVEVLPASGILPTYHVNVSIAGCTSSTMTSAFTNDPYLRKGVLRAETDCGAANITWTGVGTDYCTDSFSAAGLLIGQYYHRAATAKGTIGTRPFKGSGGITLRWFLVGFP